MKAFSKREKLKSFISPKMTDMITFLDKNEKSDLYIGGNIHRLYYYLEMIGYQSALTTSVQRSHNFGSSSSTKNDSETLQTFILALRMRQKSICKCCGRIGHRADSCIIRVPNFFPQSIRKNMNHFNAIHGDEPTDPPREWNIQSPESHFKFRTSPPKTNTVVSAIVGILNDHTIDNGDIEVHPSEFTVESNSKDVPDLDTTPIK